MKLETHPTAAASYARSLVARGCSRALARLVGEVLARTDDTSQYTAEEKALIARAYAQLIR